MSISQLVNTDDTDEVSGAVSALLTMSKTVSSEVNLQQNTQDDNGSAPSSATGLFDRVLNKTRKAYEETVATSPMLQLVGSGIRTLSRPVMGSQNTQQDNVLEADNELRRRRECKSSSPSHRPGGRIHRTSQSNGSSTSASYSPYPNPNNSSVVSGAASTSRRSYAQLVMDGGAAIAAVGAVVSEESMKSLKYCQQWLLYATRHIDRQIAVLRQFILNLTTPSSNTALIPSSASATLASIKKEVVETLRKVIEVISLYAGACLSEQARRSVRSFILSLPKKWEYVNRQEHSTSPSPMSSPHLPPANAHPINQTTDYARRLLSLANESKEMLGSVCQIFADSVIRAEAWVDKLSSVGIPSGGAAAMGNIHFPSIPQTYDASSHNGPHRSPATNNYANAKHSHTTSFNNEDDEYSNDSDNSSTESETEDKRMKMDPNHERELKNVNLSKQQARVNGESVTAKKRQKKGNKDNMDLSN
ncbi:10896_t:CDS:2 [Paraglomus occultum]|uniref:10896_t:CDS:1 n=1 Tax=Paraglomus occultum TaxID=144539 RepID=A0A9N9BEE4_9GLOM|nr:10896_t:CDS:2 [Paraglomus occultum]